MKKSQKKSDCKSYLVSGCRTCPNFNLGQYRTTLDPICQCTICQATQPSNLAEYCMVAMDEASPTPAMTYPMAPIDPHAIPPIRGVVETLDGAGNVTDSRAANLAVLRESWAADWALYAATGTGVLGVSGVTLAAIFYFV